MNATTPSDLPLAYSLSVPGLDGLIGRLRGLGYRVIGPTVRGEAIELQEIASVTDLPRGWTDEQSAGCYRLARRGDDALFAFTVGAHSWKRFLFPPRERLWRAEREDGAVLVQAEPDPVDRYAFLGVRSCDLHAIAVQDGVFLGQAYEDPFYRARRAAAFVVAVSCTQAGGTCFCASMGTGPRATGGFDLALTEVVTARGRSFLVEVGSEAGAAVLREVEHEPAGPEEIAAAAEATARCAANIERAMPPVDLHDLLQRSLEHPRWDDVARRCLSCGSCTLVCPTCFCTAVEDETDLSGTEASRSRRWDSCFTAGFSYVQGGSVRASTRSRYRQWLTHKLSTWVDQFGTSGCVGCGRCITWCPAGIDITVEAAAIAAAPQASEAHAAG